MSISFVEKVTLGRLKSKSLPAFKAGDTISVYVRVTEGGKERIQMFKGVVLKIQGRGAARSFTVRKISAGVGVERTFPFASPAIDRIRVDSVGKVRRSRLYYLRNLAGRAARLESDVFKSAAGSSASEATANPDEVTATAGNAAETVSE